MKVIFITQEEITLYSKKILRLKQGENALDIGSQDIENYKKEIEERKLNIEVKSTEEVGAEVVSGDKGKKEKSSKKSNGIQ